MKRKINYKIIEESKSIEECKTYAIKMIENFSKIEKLLYEIVDIHEKIEIVYAIFSRKSKKIYISCKNKEVLSLSLKLNLFSLILDIINFIMHILIFMIAFTIFSSGFNCLFFIVIYIFFSFFINFFLAVKRISLVEN